MTANISDNLANWSTTDASNQPDGTDTADIDADFRRLQAVVRKYMRNKGADIASASTVDLSAATGDYVDITGTTSITGLGTVSAGMRFILQFDDALTLTHSANLVLPGAANITTAAGDHAVFESLGGGAWRCISFLRAAGPVNAAAAGANTDITSLASPALGAATATTQSAGDNSTKVATTAYVDAAVPTASDTVAGKVELATDAETEAGTDADRAVTPAGLAGFSKSLGTSGYCRLPGGLLLNWGEGTYSDNQAVSFAQAFTALYQVVATAIADGNQPVMVNNRSTSGFNIQHTTSSLTVGWIAIGV